MTDHPNQVPAEFVPPSVWRKGKADRRRAHGATDGHKFVNGVLDKLAPALREAEVKANKR